ncbi:SixA phosphatase family protein [Streptomyces sp. NBC_00158]|uniref:SixA phosphatase family protein n=1 Tax=Streptomyces sp. NBC_00158 TaxID=2903627 RepID=UPI00324B7A74
MSGKQDGERDGKRERRLVLVRHAKAVPKGDAEDFERPLADRGRADAEAMGHRLGGSPLGVGLVLCSPAKRTRQTWQLMEPPLSDRPPVVYPDELYDADAEALRAAVAGTDDGVTGLLLVGHNPAIHDLAAALPGDGPPELLERIRTGLPTCAVVVLDLTGGWPDLAPGTCRLTALHTPAD